MLLGYSEFGLHMHLFPECDVDGTIVDRVKMDVLYDCQTFDAYLFAVNSLDHKRLTVFIKLF